MTYTQHILVIEDDPDGQEVVAHVLNYLAIPLDRAENGERALQLLGANPTRYRAVIIDLALPGMDGWEVLRTIKADPITANLACLAVTAFHTSKLRAEALQAGFSGYFPKPLDAALFASQLEQALV